MTIILRENKTDNLNKFYQAMLMGFWMGLVELLMLGIATHSWTVGYTLLMILLIVGIILFSWFIYDQVGINENQFMLAMIEHHQMAIEMARLVRPKTNNPKLSRIVEEIINSQEEEIDEMKEILCENGVPQDFTSLFYR